MQWVYVFVGGGIGSLCRFALSHYNQPDRVGWAAIVGTFMANILACIALGYIYAQYKSGGLSPSWYWILGAGFCGGFSTFSTWSLEMVQYMHKGDIWSGMSYLIASVIVGVIGIYLGMRIGG